MTISNNIARVAPAAYNGEAARADVVDAISKAVGKVVWLAPNDKGERKMADKSRALYDTVQTEYLVGYIAFKLFGKLPEADALAQARLVLDKANPDAKGKVAGKRRTAKEQAAYKAGRVSWSRLKADAGLTSPHRNANNKNAEGKTGGETSGKGAVTAYDGAPDDATTQAILKAMPAKAKDAAEVKAEIGRMAMAMLAYVNKQAAVADNTSKSFAQDVVTLARKVAILPKADK